MKLAVVFAVVIGSAFAAPADDLTLDRTKKSAISQYSAGSYGASYGPPCAGAAPLAPVALYLAPQGAPHYREDDLEEHSEQARSYDGQSYGASAPAISLAAPVASGASAYFPHGKIGPCGVPLLLSCSPNVVAGHLSHGYGGYSAPAYKQTEKEETTELKEAMEKSGSQSQRDANNLGLHHHHHLDGGFLTGDHKALGEHDHVALSHKSSL